MAQALLGTGPRRGSCSQREVGLAKVYRGSGTHGSLEALDPQADEVAGGGHQALM